MPPTPLPAVKRHQLLLERLRREGVLRTSRLPEEMGVTSMTVWRDLRLLEEQGLLRRGRGTVMSLREFDGEADFESKDLEAAAVKQAMARLAVERFVRAGDHLAMEGGTSVAALADHLPDSHVSVTTNSLPIALRMRRQRPALPLRVIGGWLSNVSGNTTGPDALREIEKYRFSVCFLSATGWDGEKGPLDPNPLEIEVKRALAARSDNVVLLMHAHKFSRKSTSVMLHPKRIDALITHQPPPENIRRQLTAQGVELLLARSPTRN